MNDKIEGYDIVRGLYDLAHRIRIDLEMRDLALHEIFESGLREKLDPIIRDIVREVLKEER